MNQESTMTEPDAPDLAARIAARRADPEFTARLHETMEQNRRALERLGDDEAHPGRPTPAEMNAALREQLAEDAALDAERDRQAADEDADYARLAAAQDDEDRAYHEAIRGRRRGGENG
jgi:hypothetical protein